MAKDTRVGERPSVAIRCTLGEGRRAPLLSFCSAHAELLSSPNIFFVGKQLFFLPEISDPMAKAKNNIVTEIEVSF